MIGMNPSDAIKLDQVSLVKRENYPEEDKLPEDVIGIITYYNLVKNMITIDTEQLIEYGLKRHID